MEKIIFKNGEEPYLNDTNLNKLQENIEQAIDEKSSLPVGGTTGQILAKASNNDNDVEWIDNEGGTGVDSTPIGSIFIYASNTIPSKWLLCNGQEINREEYSNLFNIIGTIYGEGDGETTFNLPNLKGRVPIGKYDNDYDFDVLGKTGGEKEHTLTINEMPNHNHKIGVDNNTFGAGSYPNNRALEGTGLTTSSTGGGQAHNNLQPYIVLNYIIKAK